MFFSKARASEEHQDSETSVALMTERQSRWSAFRSSRPSLQKFLGPFQCLPVAELLRQRQSKSANGCFKKGGNAIQSPDDITTPITLDLNACESSQPTISTLDLEPGARADDHAWASAKEHEPTKLPLLSDHQEDASKCSSEKDNEDVNMKRSSLVPTVLDVDFARVTLRSSDTWPNYDFFIEGLDSIITTDGALALLNFLDFVLNLPEIASSGFVLTYDVRKLTCPQLDLMSWIMRYIVEPQHEEVWQQRCVCCKVIVQSGIYYSVAESFFSFLFTVYKPPCRVFLTTELGETNRATWRCFKPEDEFDDGLGFLSSIGAGFFDVLLPPFPHETPAQQERAASHSTKAVPESKPSSSEGDALSLEVAHDNERRASCPDFLEVDFCTLSQGFDKTSNMGYLKVVGNANPMLDESLAKVMDFMDAFVNSPNAEQGFSITYDLRKLGIPSMSQVMRVADWGKNSVRQDKWMKLNVACKVVVTAGIRFSMTAAVLKSFFYICPPVCRTTILTDLDEPEENGVVFLPPSDVKEKESTPDDTNSEDGSVSSCGFPADASESTTHSAAEENGALKSMEPGAEKEQDKLSKRANWSDSETRGLEKPKERCSDFAYWEPNNTHSWIPDSFHVDMW